MSVYRRLFDALIAIVLSAVTIALTASVTPGLAQPLGMLVACVFYFSRHPWGSQDGERINERIDDLYDRYLPV
jgi:hypothetical protein